MNVAPDLDDEAFLDLVLDQSLSLRRTHGTFDASSWIAARPHLSNRIQEVLGLAAPWTPAVPRGTHIGRYELQKEIGRGAMGIVDRVRDVSLDRTVALKTLPLASSLWPQARRFRRASR